MAVSSNILNAWKKHYGVIVMKDCIFMLIVACEYNIIEAVASVGRKRTSGLVTHFHSSDIPVEKLP